MKLNTKIMVLMILTILLPMTTGCLFKSGSNPVADTSAAQTLAQNVSNPVTAQKLACSYAKPSTERKFTFSRSNHELSHKFKENIRRVAGSLKFCLYGSSNTDNIFITLEKMTVKPERGPKVSVNISERKIDLLSATDLSEVLADAELPEGKYKYMEFYIKSAEIAIDGQTHNMFVPARKVRFFGSFEIKEGYTTNLSVKFMHRVVKWRFFGRNFYVFIPIVRISSELVLKPVDPAITEGDVDGWVENFVSLQKLSGVAVSLEGTGFNAVTDAEGKFSFASVPAGVYNLKTSHPDFLDGSFSVEVLAGQVASVSAQINPAVIRSSVGTTGWFSEIYPLAEANGTYGETSIETPIEIDFVSLAFTKAEIKFTGEYHGAGAGRFHAFLASNQQISADDDLGSWWAGYTASTGTFLGEYYARNPGVEYVVDVTDAIRNNPSNAYFLAAKNLDLIDIKISNIQLSIYYR